MLDDEIDELEDGIDSWPSEQVRRRLSELRHDVLQIRRTLSPTRDAVRRVVDGRVDVGEDEIFGRSLELDFADAYDKLLRATEALDISRELIADARDYHQSKIAQDQNEIVKKLAVIASLLLVPTFIVGVYGQNFDHMPELHWRLGYAFSWALIVVTTIAPARLLPLEEVDLTSVGRLDSMPYFICPNCKDRSVDDDGRQGLLRQAVACERCGFGFLFELLDDYYPAPNTGLVACDRGGRILAGRPRRVRADRLPRALS